jgi:hypothetical protein
MGMTPCPVVSVPSSKVGSLCVSVDLHQFFERVQELGGYQGCVSKKAWKQVYDDLGGNPQNTSAATCTRRHYERFV